MSSTITLTPCPNCGYPHNQGQVKNDYWSRGFQAYVISEVNCRNCGTFYDGKTNFINAAPIKNSLFGCVAYLAVMAVFFVVVMFVLGVFYSITN